MSKAAVDLNVYPRLFGSADVPDQECHEVWLYLTYYGANYNFPAATSEQEHESDEEYACSPRSEFMMIKEPLEASQNSQWSFESVTEQLLTPKIQKNPFHMETVDEWAPTARMGQISSTKSSPLKFGNLKSPSIIMEEEEEEGDQGNDINEGNIFGLRKAGPGS
ncbi:hypothetical protein TWF696_004279 [Orbilia brochopaga]|uniref:Uncharacterized protein n=1 Tax=Orbilia brochopaga TaxID=3140254 RepID=A0AAV9V6W0_9PEZI